MINDSGKFPLAVDRITLLIGTDIVLSAESTKRRVFYDVKTFSPHLFFKHFFVVEMIFWQEFVRARRNAAMWYHFFRRLKCPKIQVTLLQGRAGLG